MAQAIRLRFLLLFLLSFSAATVARTTAPAAPQDSVANTTLTVDEVIARFVKARGGEEKLGAVHAVRMMRHVVYKPAQIGEPTQEYDRLMEWKRPNQMRMEMRTTQGTYQVNVYSEGKGWKTNATKPGVDELTEQELKAQPTFSDAIESELYKYHDKGYSVSMRDAQSQGKPCYGILTTRPSGTPIYRCLDKTTFLDIERRTESSTTLVSDYRAVNGVMFPFRFESSSKDGTTIETVQDVQTNVDMADSEFAKPKPLEKNAPRGIAQAAKVFGAPDGKQVRAAQKQIIDAIEHVRTCPALPFVPACSFGAAPSQFKITQKKIEFYGPVNKEWGGPRPLFIDFTAVPGLKPVARETWRLLNPEQMYVSFDSTERKYDKQSTNALFERPRLEWATNSPYVKQFLDALEVLKANAKAPTDALQQEEAGFQEAARKWRELPEKPPLPDGVHREEVLAKNAITEDKNPESALQHFEKGLAIEPLWPAGQLGAATICGELQRYDCAVTHGEMYLEMLPNGPQSDVLRDKVIIWKDKLGKE